MGYAFFPVTMADVSSKFLNFPLGHHISVPTVSEKREKIVIENIKNISMAKSVRYKNHIYVLYIYACIY